MISLFRRPTHSHSPTATPGRAGFSSAEYIIMLEPDNTIHRSILHPPTHDAGGLYDENPHFSRELVAHAEAIAHKIKPEFNWSYTGSGLAGGSCVPRWPTFFCHLTRLRCPLFCMLMCSTLAVLSHTLFLCPNPSRARPT